MRQSRWKCFWQKLISFINDDPNDPWESTKMPPVSLNDVIVSHTRSHISLPLLNPRIAFHTAWSLVRTICRTLGIIPLASISLNLSLNIPIQIHTCKLPPRMCSLLSSRHSCSLRFSFKSKATTASKSINLSILLKCLIMKGVDTTDTYKLLSTYIHTYLSIVFDSSATLFLTFEYTGSSLFIVSPMAKLEKSGSSISKEELSESPDEEVACSSFGYWSLIGRE